MKFGGYVNIANLNMTQDVLSIVTLVELVIK